MMVECFTTVGWHLKANLLPRHTFRNSFCTSFCTQQNPTESSLFLPTFPFKLAQWSFQILNNDQMDGREVKVGWERACDTKSSRPCRPEVPVHSCKSWTRCLGASRSGKRPSKDVGILVQSQIHWFSRSLNSKRRGKKRSFNTAFLNKLVSIPPT